jgi:hypothetical protein
MLACGRLVELKAELAAEREALREAKEWSAGQEAEAEALMRRLNEANEARHRAEAERDEAGRILGVVCCAVTLQPGESLIDPPKHAAVSAILTVIAERDTAWEYHRDALFLLAKTDTMRMHTEESLRLERERADALVADLAETSKDRETMRHELMSQVARMDALMADLEMALEVPNGCNLRYDVKTAIQRARAAEKEKPVKLPVRSGPPLEFDAHGELGADEEKEKAR